MEKDLDATARPHLSDQKPRWEFPHRGLTDRILGAAVQVHCRLGPGFIEKMYENALCLEFGTRRLAFDRQVPVLVLYEGTEIGLHRLDLIIEGKVVVEVKAIKEFEDVHLATMLSYLKATRLEAGLLLSFAAARLRIRRVVRTGRSTAEAPTGGSIDEGFEPDT
jgi:GxxExxY protein